MNEEAESTIPKLLVPTVTGIFSSKQSSILRQVSFSSLLARLQIFKSKDYLKCVEDTGEVWVLMWIQSCSGLSVYSFEVLNIFQWFCSFFVCSRMALSFAPYYLFCPADFSSLRSFYQTARCNYCILNYIPHCPSGGSLLISDSNNPISSSFSKRLNEEIE